MSKIGDRDFSYPYQLPQALQQRVGAVVTAGYERDGNFSHPIRHRHPELGQLEIHLAQQVQDASQMAVRIATEETYMTCFLVHAARYIVPRSLFFRICLAFGPRPDVSSAEEIDDNKSF